MESWITTDIKEGNKNGNVKVTAEPNLSVFDRLGTVKVSTATLEKYLTVIQKKGNIKMKHVYILIGSQSSPILVDTRNYNVGDVISVMGIKTMSSGNISGNISFGIFKNDSMEEYSKEELYQIFKEEIPLVLHVGIWTIGKNENTAHIWYSEKITIPSLTGINPWNTSLTGTSRMVFDRGSLTTLVYTLDSNFSFDISSSELRTITAVVDLGILVI